MPAEVKKEIQLEVAHVLFIDIVGYSKLLITEQSDQIQKLRAIVRETEQFRLAEAEGKLLRLPTGDGGALVFRTSPEAPVLCAMEISEELKKHPELHVRMGIHSGPVNEITDLNEQANIAGAGINIAQRVMDCGDAGHILLSKHVADDLEQYPRWRPYLHELGECEVKHGVRIDVVNFYRDEIGNPQVPKQLKVLQKRRARTRWTAIAAALLSLIGVVIAFIIVSKKSAQSISTIPEKSIAVLPFENLSDDKENAYFAGGIQDDVLTNLAKIGDLKVISRTSVVQYRSNAQNVREIGKALGVAAVLEGSVRRAGNRVRVNVQLIDTSNDQHIWAEDYDRELTDVFAIQSDVASQIASVLQAKLSPHEKALVQRKPTENAQAYLLYLQALDGFDITQSNEDRRKIEQLLEKAIQLDSSFALAFARLSMIESTSFLNNDNVPGRLEKARATAKEALRLQPELPEGHFALGQVFLRERDYNGALEELNIAKLGLPNNAQIFEYIGAVERRQGKWAEAIADQEKAASLNPKDPFIWQNIATSYSALRQFADAAKAADRGCATDPNFLFVHVFRAYLDIGWKGDTTLMEQLLARTPEQVDPSGLATWARFQLKLFQRKYGEALQAVVLSQRDPLTDLENQRILPKSFVVAQAYQLAKDQPKAQSAFEEAKKIVQHALAQNPLDAAQHALLGEINAHLGLKEEAIHEGKQAIELLPESSDAYSGPLMTLALARIDATLGDSDSAVPLLEHSLSSPNGITTPLLRLDPVWDPIRNDPRFEALTKKIVPRSAR